MLAPLPPYNATCMLMVITDYSNISQKNQKLLIKHCCTCTKYNKLKRHHYNYSIAWKKTLDCTVECDYKIL